MIPIKSARSDIFDTFGRMLGGSGSPGIGTAFRSDAPNYKSCTASALLLIATENAGALVGPDRVTPQQIRGFCGADSASKTPERGWNKPLRQGAFR